MTNTIFVEHNFELQLFILLCFHFRNRVHWAVSLDNKRNNWVFGCFFYILLFIDNILLFIDNHILIIVILSVTLPKTKSTPDRKSSIGKNMQVCFFYDDHSNLKLIRSHLF